MFRLLDNKETCSRVCTWTCLHMYRLLDKETCSRLCTWIFITLHVNCGAVVLDPRQLFGFPLA